MSIPTPYNGNEKYIFVSYSHKDSHMVYPVIIRLIEAGFRVWFDQGIDPGTEWDENIAQHIDDCGYFAAFLSKNYLASSNCKDELNYARDLEKERLIVYLEELTLPSGMAMRINRLQSIFMYTYRDENAFYEKLFSAKNLDSCRNIVQTQQETAYVPVAAVTPNDTNPGVATEKPAYVPAPQPKPATPIQPVPTQYRRPGVVPGEQPKPVAPVVRTQPAESVPTAYHRPDGKESAPVAQPVNQKVIEGKRKANPLVIISWIFAAIGTIFLVISLGFIGQEAFIVFGFGVISTGLLLIARILSRGKVQKTINATLLSLSYLLMVTALSITIESGYILLILALLVLISVLVIPSIVKSRKKRNTQVLSDQNKNQ